MGFQQVSLFEVVVPLEHDAAITTCGHLGDFVPEMPDAFDGCFVDHLTVTQEPDVGAPGDAALGYAAAGGLLP